MIRHLDKIIRPLVLVLPKMWGYLKKFKDKSKNKKENNKLSLCINDNKPLEKYNTNCTKIKDLTNIELDSFPAYYDKYIEAKVGTYANKVYTNFCGLGWRRMRILRKLWMKCFQVSTICCWNV